MAPSVIDEEAEDSALEDYDHFEAVRKPSPHSTKQPSEDGLDEAESELLDEDVDEGVEGLDELAAPVPDENPDEERTEYHRSLEEEREIGNRRSATQKHIQATRRPSLQQRLLMQLYTHSWLIMFSILGTLARLGVEWITEYRNAPVTTNVLWANFGGSLILGFLQEDRALFAEKRGRHLLSNSHSSSGGDDTNEKEHSDAQADQTARKKSMPLYIGLAVGFCGSFTSYSSFMRDLFLALSDELMGKGQAKRARSAGWSAASVLGVVITEVTVSLSALSFGAHLAIALLPLLSKIPQMNTAKSINPLGVFLGLGCWSVAVCLTIWPPHNAWRGQAVFAIVFAPLGTMMRYWLSVQLNRRIKSFPIGTFSANMLGTALLAMAYDLQHADLQGNVAGGSIVGCQVLTGITEGFCGCLTTVSTWVAELRSLRKKHAYLYGATSIVLGFSLMVVIMGALEWTLGIRSPVCKL
ncbi:Fluoride export protein 1 [Alternaria gaisen]|uniref:Fluoride export protein 1 n=1 Tax=Alternaria gaisen TaxID=167740 RepID=A0ACB6G0X4_9PLEO|nr:Fluoride export protein 1 [Alternaria gaisen]